MKITKKEIIQKLYDIEEKEDLKLGREVQKVIRNEIIPIEVIKLINKYDKEFLQIYDTYNVIYMARNKNPLWFESLRYTSVSSSTVLVSMQPLFSLVWGFLFLKERIRLSAVTGCLIAIAGSAVIGWGDFSVNSAALFGDLLALSSAGVISLYFLIGQVTRKNTGVISYSVLSYFSSAAFLLVYALMIHAPLSGYGTVTWCSFLGLAFLSTIGGQFVFNLLLKDISATMVSMGILGEPVGTCVLAFLILKETIAPRQFTGIIIIMAGLSVYFFYPLMKEQGKIK